MKKFCIIIFLIFGLICRVYAVENKNDILLKMENEILGVDYSNQKTEQRLSRLEEYVYGQKRSGSSSERIKKLAKDLNADVIGQSEPNEFGSDDEEEYADESVDYPILDEVEKKLSMKSPQGQSLHSRIAAIEKKLFNKSFEADDFYTRVERIKEKSHTGTDIIADEDEGIMLPEVRPDRFGNSDILPQRYGNSDSANYDYKLTALERKVLNSTFPDENSNDRLARLESRVFDTEFYYDNESDRIERLESAINAKRTSNKYDNNKFQQKLNTALQIGAMVLMVLAFIL